MAQLTKAQKTKIYSAMRNISDWRVVLSNEGAHVQLSGDATEYRSTLLNDLEASNKELRELLEEGD